MASDDVGCGVVGFLVSRLPKEQWPVLTLVVVERDAALYRERRGEKVQAESLQPWSVVPRHFNTTPGHSPLRPPACPDSHRTPSLASGRALLCIEGMEAE